MVSTVTRFFSKNAGSKKKALIRNEKTELIRNFLLKFLVIKENKNNNQKYLISIFPLDKQMKKTFRQFVAYKPRPKVFSILV